jgi:hypothetical protein
MKLDMIAFEAEMKRLRGAYIVDIAPACEMYRAALARAEAAEAERDDANIEAALEQGNAAAAWQRVADLEAELAAVKAAGEWRTTDPPRNGVFLAEITAVASDDVIRQWGPGGNILRVSRWRPLPQPDAPQEPTS